MTNWKMLVLSIRFSGRHPLVRVALFSVLVGFISLAVVLMAWAPAHLKNAKLENDVNTQREIISKAEYNKKFSSLYARSKKTFHAINKKLNKQHSQSEHVKQLDKMLQKRRIRVVNEVYDSEKTPGGYTKLSQELSVQGDYGDLRRFIIELDGLPSWTIIQELRIEKLNSYSSKIKAVLKMATYYAES